MTPTQCTPQGNRFFFTVFAASLATTAVALSGCAPTDAVQFADASVTPASGGATVPGSGGASSGGAQGSGGASGTGGARTGGAMGSGGASGTGGARTGGAMGSGGASGTGGRAGGASGTGGRGGSASGGSMGGGGNTAVTFAPVATILGTSCGTGQCHQGGAHVDLRNTAGLHGRIVSKMVSGSGTEMACQSKSYVVPNDLANSVISQIIKAAVTGCGARMPDGCSTSSTNPRPCLTAAQIMTIDNWIMAGAPM